MTKLQSGHDKNTHFVPLTSKCDLDLDATDIDLARDTLSHGGQHFRQVLFLNPPKNDKVIEWTRNADRRTYS